MGNFVSSNNTSEELDRCWVLSFLFPLTLNPTAHKPRLGFIIIDDRRETPFLSTTHDGGLYQFIDNNNGVPPHWLLVSVVYISQKISKVADQQQ